MGRWEEIALHEAQREKGQGEGRELERMKWEQARNGRVIAGTELRDRVKKNTPSCKRRHGKESFNLTCVVVSIFQFKQLP